MFGVVLSCAVLAQQAQPAPGAGLIVGRVVDATTDKAITGAVVNLNGGATRVRVDSKGQFLFRNLAGGSYTMSAEKAGYVYGRYGQLRPSGVGMPLELADGERIADIVIKLWRQGAIEGTVTDEKGEPVAGVNVQAYSLTTSAGRTRLGGQGWNKVTDDRGVYHFGDLPPGEYFFATNARSVTFPASFVAASVAAQQAGGAALREFQNQLTAAGAAPMDGATLPGARVGDAILGRTFAGDLLRPIGADGRVWIYPTTFAPSGATTETARRFTLAAGELRSGADLQVRAVPAIRISGTAIGPAGPIAHLGLRLMVNWPEVWTQTLFQIATTVTDASGAFSMLGVPPGQYTLWAQTTPAPAGPGPQQTLSKDPTFFAALPISAVDKDLTDLAIVLRPTLHISGRVEFDGTTEKPTGPRLNAIRLAIDPADGRSAGPQPVRLQTQIEPSGAFVTTGLTPGKYFVHVSTTLGAPALPAGWYLKSATLGGRDVTNDVPLVLESNDLDGLVVTFTDHPSRLGGVVRDATGAPDRYAEVLVFAAESALWSDNGAFATRMRSVTTSRTGAYATPNLPAGDYYAIAIPGAQASDWQDPKFLSRVAAGALRVHITDGASVTLDLRTSTVPR